MNKNLRLTWCALSDFPSAARITSQNCSVPKSRPKTFRRLLWWLFHFRQYCWELLLPWLDAILGWLRRYLGLNLRYANVFRERAQKCEWIECAQLFAILPFFQSLFRVYNDALLIWLPSHIFRFVRTLSCQICWSFPDSLPFEFHRRGLYSQWTCSKTCS